MHRRHLVAAFAAALPAALATRALAQDAAAGTMGEAELNHAQQTGMVGALSLMQSRMAVNQAENEQVRAFAQFEVMEQETIADILTNMQAGNMEVSGEVQPPADEDLVAMIDENGQAALAELEGLSGAEFDAAYVAANLEGHQQLLAIQEEYLASGTNREHVSITKLARGMITEHINHLEALQGQMG